MDQRYGTEPGSELRPLSAGQTLGAALGVYSGNALQLWAAVAVVVVPLELIELIIRLSSIPSGSFVHDGTLYTNNLTTASSGLGASLVVALIGGLAQLLAIGAVFRLVLDDYLGRHTSVQESFEFAADRLLSLLWIAILVAVLVGIGFVLLLLPGVYLLVAFSVAIPVLMAEGIKGMRALTRSRQLVSGRWWATFGRLFIAWLLLVVLSLVFAAVNVASALSVSSVTVYLVVNTVVAGITAILTAPFTAAVATVIYIDLRVRKEGADRDQLLSGEVASGGWPPSYIRPPGAGDAYGFGGPSTPERPSPPETLGGWPRNQQSPYVPPPPPEQPPSEPNTGGPEDADGS